MERTGLNFLWPGRLQSLDWTLLDWSQSGGLDQTAIEMPFRCRTENYAAYHFTKVAPLACLQLVWTPDRVRSAVQTWSQWGWPLSCVSTSQRSLAYLICFYSILLFLFSMLQQRLLKIADLHFKPFC